MRDAVSTVLRERDDILDRDNLRSLLLAVAIFLERLDADPTIREVIEDVEQDTASLLLRFREHDAATIVRLKAIREEVPRLPIDDAPDHVRDGHTLSTFDALTTRKSEVPEVPAPGDIKNPSTSQVLIGALYERLNLTEEPLQKTLRTKIRQVEKEHEHAAIAFLDHAALDPGFALRRLRLLARQLNPRPGNALSDELFDEHYRNVYCLPELLRVLVTGSQPGAPEAASVTNDVREDVRTISRELVRRLSVTRSRAGLLRTYRLRCEWYDADAIGELVESLQEEQRKEDRLVDHLALFLFDNGLRPLTRSMAGGLIPDVFEDFPTGPSFYIEAKQYGDVAGARKAIAEGPRQIWSTAHTLSGRYDLEEAFLVVFRRGGPLLRFAGPATANGLVLRPVLIDVAPAKLRGSRQADIIDVTVPQLLASSS
jgi:hypothetical protein